MNIYKKSFIVRCPNNGKAISYALELRVPDGRRIMVEHIDTALALIDQGFHEDIADQLFERFGGQQIIKAHHHGIDIETTRGFEPQSFDGRTKQRVVMGKTVFEKGVAVQTVADAAQAAAEAAQIADVFSGEYPR